MLYRCYSIPETRPEYAYYRGKGIAVCEEWINNIKSFYSWCIENGWENGLVIDRINSNGNYEPSNCQFITASENSKRARLQHDQRGMKSSNHKLIDDDVKEIKHLFENGKTTAEIARLFNVGFTAIAYIRHGLSWKHI